MSPSPTNLEPWIERIEIDADGWSMFVHWFELVETPDDRPWWKRLLRIDPPPPTYRLHLAEARSRHGIHWGWQDEPGGPSLELCRQAEEIVRFLERSKKGVWRLSKDERPRIETGGPYRRR